MFANLVKNAPFLPAVLLTAAALTGCQIADRPLSTTSDADLRATAHAFTNAVKAGDATELARLSTVPKKDESPQLADAIIKDTVSERQVQSKLTEKFNYNESRESIIASDAWLNSLHDTAANAPIQHAGDRALVGDPNSCNRFYLRHVDGSWKVELIPTLVPESGGAQTVQDPVVTYRFGVAKSLNDWLLQKFANNELHTKEDYDKARNAFWLQYLAHAASGEDPSKTLLPTLPEMPKNTDIARD